LLEVGGPERVEAVHGARDPAVQAGIRVGTRFAGGRRALGLRLLPGAGKALQQLRIDSEEGGDEQDQPATDSAA
jgi:hypothetical protein